MCTGQSGSKQYMDLGPQEYPIPAIIISGKYPGKTVLVTAQIHSGEYPATSAVSRAAKQLDPSAVHGKVIFLPCVNMSGFRRETDAFVPEDGGNLNRDYPGDGSGTTAEIARYFIGELFPQADFVLDLHSGGIPEKLTPCVFVPYRMEKELMPVLQVLDIPHAVRSHNCHGEAGYAANMLGIPSLLLERGYGGLCMQEWIDAYMADILAVLGSLGIVRAPDRTVCKKTYYTEAVYPEAQEEGLWFPCICEDTYIRKGETIGHTEDIYGNLLRTYTAEADGLVLYYRTALHVSKGTPIAAYALLSSAFSMTDHERLRK